MPQESTQTTNGHASPEVTKIVLASRPTGKPTHDNFRVEKEPLPSLEDGYASLETLFLSLDPYMRGRMSDAESYAAPVALGETMVGATVSRVIESTDETLQTGDIVLGYGGWQTHSVEPISQLKKLELPEGISPSVALGALGMPGFTAWAGLHNIGKPQAGETVVVAAATGPVGSMVGQLAKKAGARVVGIAGGEKKTAFLKELGFDAAIDHKADNFEQQLEQATPDGIDVYFENVGGKVLNAVLPRLNTYARIPLCGLVSGYNATELPAGPNRSGQLMATFLKKSVTVRGFIQLEFASQMDQFLNEVMPWVVSGEVTVKEHIVEGLDNVIDAFNGMLDGSNFGKTVIKL